MTDRIPLDDMTSDQLDQLYAELDALRQVARGYCPACGRGDAAPTVADWEQQKTRADQAEADLDRARAEANAWAEAESADVAAGSYAGRVEELQNTLDRVRALGERWRYTGDRKHTALPELLSALDGPAPAPPGPVATEAARPATWLLAGTRDLSIPTQHQFTVRPVDPELERAATARAVQAAQDHEHATAQLTTLGAPPVPCPACARAGQAGLADNEQHPECRNQEQH
jgi:hypothetical protein